MTAQPIAWLAFAADGSESQMVTLLREEADAAARDWGWSVTPLYAGLTDEERQAVEKAAQLSSDWGPEWADHTATLRGLLERTVCTKNGTAG